MQRSDTTRTSTHRRRPFRWDKTNRIASNLFLQEIVVPEKRAVDTTEAECKIMAQTKRCEVMPMKFADDKWLYVPEPSENVTGDKHFFIIILKLGSKGNKTSDLILDRTTSKPTKEELEYIRIRDDYYNYPEDKRMALLKLLQSHVQYLKDKTLDKENEILRAAHDMNCQITRIKRSMAVAAAQYDAWLAAGKRDYLFNERMPLRTKITFTTAALNPSMKTLQHHKMDGSLQPTSQVTCPTTTSTSTVNITCTATTPGSCRKLPLFQWSKASRSHCVTLTTTATNTNNRPTPDIKLSSPAQ
ncbi:hypothetical protein DAPPUDRAFT_106152 [Daphnia pulex]|uniref:Uncharacterized protein n=1 Tax=Daphnia pulex TaxID=6669 RepID=E9GSX1_DAPPU|nr:hypothetical protein DAPPUDRAFT_106152 [Daphnia pulex]|eukprot:EFX77506.1 hypothetical protein DAPPUDRAFT_106152 [Daphnia pulex]